MKRLFLFLLISLFVLQAHAQGNSADSLLNKQIEFLQKSIRYDSRAGNIWWKSWLAGYSAATLVQTGIALASDEKAMRQDMYLGAATTLIGAAGQFISPMVQVEEKYYKEDAFLNQTDHQPMLASYEEMLDRLALREREGRSWKTHAMAGSVNLGSGLITWLGFKRDVWAGLGNFALNTCITEAQIWSQPMRARKDLKRYKESFANGNYAMFSERGKIDLSIASGPGYCTLKIVF